MEQEHYHHHRQRLRERFLKHGLESFADYEAVELLLTLAIPHKDVKVPAKLAIERFGSFRDVLDFLFERFDDILGPAQDGKYLGRWSARWTAIEGAAKYFNKLTEELIGPAQLRAPADPFLQAIGHAYQAYVDTLFATHRIDFAHQQKLFLELLDNPAVGPAITSRVRYVMVDEYQDTNYVQEQLLLRLAGPRDNLCVVGDEDQAMYRFRGATVRNILEFHRHFPQSRTVTLSVNYRSHVQIVAAYNKFMASWDWNNPTNGPPFRYDKTIIPDPETTFPEYPAVLAIWGESRQDETRRVADLVAFLKEHRIIEDESQVALLLHSVQLDHSEPYLQALASHGIPAFCPRARAYFDNDEVRFLVGCFAVLLGYYGTGRGPLSGGSLQALAAYVDGCISDLGRRCAYPHPLAACLQQFIAEIAALRPGETLDRRLADYFYQFVACEPFASWLKNDNRARNLATFSQLLNVFQIYHHYTVITARNLEPLRFHLFHSFLRLLYEGGINEYEDADQPFPKGHVQVMTIHQAKGLEFPVVIVGSLAVQLSSPKEVDQMLSPYYHRPPFEPERRITGFDRMRLHYVAFSRAEKILVLTTTDRPKPYFYPIWQGLPQWPYVHQNLLKSLFFRLRSRAAFKKMFSFTSDLKVYETWPRQYQFFRQYEFTPARSAEFFFGSLVHQTIEDVHRRVLDHRGVVPDEAQTEAMFEFNFRHLVNRGLRPIGEKQREEAFAQVMNYVNQWTGEPWKADALMVFPYRPEVVEAAGIYFDQVVAQILAKEFAITRPPEPRVCRECDLRTYCEGDGTITLRTSGL